MEGHKAGKGYKTLSKDLGNTSTVGGIIRKWKAYGTTVNLLWSKQPFKISSCVEVRLVRIAKADPKTTRREIREDLMEMGTLVSVNIISNVLCNCKTRVFPQNIKLLNFKECFLYMLPCQRWNIKIKYKIN
uniref:Transposase Tc1-like domain-containing protein n=1 Tax=Astyanax mexicanus TaxID=7994 RepID=A0A8B9JS27_ASTMX